MENNNKSQAELYREERKERLAKAAAKKAKKNPSFSRAKKILGKVIAVVLVVAICFGVVGGVLNFFGTPQKVLKVQVSDKDLNFSLAEFNYFYYNVWVNITNTSYQYESQYSQYYGEGAGVTITGYDYTKSPASQDYKDDYSSFTGITLKDLGKESATWADVMKYGAISQLVQIKYGAKLAKEAGLSMTADDQKEIDEYISSMAETAKEKDYSLDRYLRQAYGNGITEKMIRQIQEEQVLANAYFEKYATDTENSITDEQINDRYNADPDSYNIVSLRAYPFAAEYDEKADDTAKETARKKAKALADAFLASATSEEEFLKLAAAELKKDSETKDSDPDSTTIMKNTYKDDITSNISEEAANWMFNKDRKVGDKAVFTVGEDDFFVVMATALPKKDTTSAGNDVRHILFKFPDAQKDADGKEIPVTDKQKAEVKAEAEKVLAEYLKNPTEENFAALTVKYSKDVDSDGKVNNDGIYEGVNASSNYVESFRNWAIDEARKPGDVEIIETEYGYHIMYYIKSQGETWYTNIKEEILGDASTKLIDEIDAKYIQPINMDSFILKWAFKAETKHINQIVVSNLANSNA